MTVTPDDIRKATLDRIVAETENLNFQNSKLLLEVQEAHRLGNVAKASYIYQNHLVADGPIMHDTVAAWMSYLNYFDLNDPTCDITIDLTSGGGDMLHGFAFYDQLMKYRQSHRITINVLGGAFSMASVVLQAGDHRTIGAESSLMLHQPSFGMQNANLGTHMDESAYVNNMFERMLDIYARRCVATKGGDFNVVRTVINDKIGHGRQNWFIDSAESLRLGLVDEVI